MHKELSFWLMMLKNKIDKVNPLKIVQSSLLHQIMSDNLQIRRVSPEHIRLVLKTKPGERIKWPADLHGQDLFIHWRHIKDLAKKHMLKDKILLYKIKFTKTIQPKNASDDGWREVPDEKGRLEIIKTVHENRGGSHLARDTLLYELKNSYYWERQSLQSGSSSGSKLTSPALSVVTLQQEISMC
jgi:predicted heme/steroid binding protein